MRAFLKKLLPFLLITVLSFVAFRDLVKPVFFPMQDDLQIFRAYELEKCFAEGRFLCRWVPDAGFGYGYPLFSFYPPLPYYLIEFFHLFGADLFLAVRIVFILTFLLSGFFMYLLATEFFGSLGGLLSAVFYVYAPYRSVDVFVRGAMNETWGLTWFPLIFYAAYKTITEKNKALLTPFSLLLSVSTAALMLSHNVMTLIFIPMGFVWIVYWLIATKAFSSLKKLFVSGVLALGLSAFFFIPLVLEKKMVHVESMVSGYFNYLAHFADLNQLLFSRFWGYGASLWGPVDEMAFPVGHIHWILGLIVAALALFNFKRNKRQSLMVLLVLGLSPLYLFMIHSRSTPVWQVLTVLQYAQFPWRLLSGVMFLLSFGVGGLFLILKKPMLKLPIAIILIVAVILWNKDFFRAEKIVNITLNEKLSGRNWIFQTTGGIFDYLPKSASRPPGDPAPIYPEFFLGKGAIEFYTQGVDHLSFTARVSHSPASLLLPIFSYPGMKVLVDNQEVGFSHDKDLGRVIVDLPGGTHSVNVRFANTPLRQFADLYTLISFSVVAIFVLGKVRSGVNIKSSYDH